MSTAAVAADDPTAEPAGKGGKKKLLLLAIPLLLGVIGAGLWFGGILPPLLGMGKEKHVEASEKAGAPPGAAGQSADAHGGTGEATAKSTAKSAEPTYLDIPEIIVNLNAGARRTGFLKLHAKLELAKPEDVPGVTAVMPRVLDLFQTYLREMRPDELRGAAGTYRLREELIARASLAAAPAQIVDILFVEMLVQ